MKAKKRGWVAVHETGDGSFEVMDFSEYLDSAGLVGKFDTFPGAVLAALSWAAENNRKLKIGSLEEDD